MARKHGTPHLRLLVPVAGAGLLAALAGVLLRGNAEAHSVSEVVRMVREIALAGNAADAPPGAGMIGPWKIAATGIDPVSGRLLDFRLKSGRLILATREAQVHVDPDTDTFSIEMWDVVYTRLPETDSADDDAVVHSLDHYILGPAPYGIDIVPDARGTHDDARPDGPPPIVLAE